MKLETTNQELHDLETVLERTRKGSVNCTVPKLALQHLLKDHISMNTILFEKNGRLPDTTP